MRYLFWMRSTTAAASGWLEARRLFRISLNTSMTRSAVQEEDSCRLCSTAATDAMFLTFSCRSGATRLSATILAAGSSCFLATACATSTAG